MNFAKKWIHIIIQIQLQNKKYEWQETKLQETEQRFQIFSHEILKR